MKKSNFYFRWMCFNRIMCLSFFIHLNTAVFAQKIEVVPANEVIDGQSLAGLKTVLTLDEKKVKDGWKDQLKTYGKVEVPKGSKTQMEVKLANIPQITSLPLNIMSTVTSLQGSTTIFYAMRLDADYITDPKHPDFSKSKAILRDFVVKMYQESVAKEVSSAQQALDKQTKEQAQTIREGENLVKSVERNKQDKLKLQQELVKNREDSVSILKAVAVNKEEYQQALTAWESQNKLVDEIKSKASEEVSTDKKKEEQKKFDFLTKQKQSRTSEGNRLVQSQEKNEREKQNLFNKLQKNATELDHLLLSIDHNKKKQAQDIVQLDQRKKDLEAVKNRLAAIK